MGWAAVSSHLLSIAGWAGRRIARLRRSPGRGAPPPAPHPGPRSCRGLERRRPPSVRDRRSQPWIRLSTDCKTRRGFGVKRLQPQLLHRTRRRDSRRKQPCHSHKSTPLPSLLRRPPRPPPKRPTPIPSTPPYVELRYTRPYSLHSSRPRQASTRMATRPRARRP